MLPCSVYGSGEISLILMPFLGGTQFEWTESVHVLSKQYRCVTVDLPGFGAAASIGGYTVAEMADAVIELLATLQLERYVLVGHSMAGKVSAVVARQLLTDDARMYAPAAVVLVAPSPPGPEPMSDTKRDEMLGFFGTSSEDDLKAARKYIKDNTSRPLTEELIDRTAQEVLRMNREAWSAWLNSGSKEDWAERVGVVELPTLILAAEHDGALGPGVQEKVTQPHFSQAHLISVDTNHLIPLEEPAEMASLISNFLKVL
jgi:pimeloyl-ACP methyl ester carboxylesterase